jgi:hypothetical protein
VASRERCVLLFCSSRDPQLGVLPGFPCMYRVESRCCRPMQDSNARLALETIGCSVMLRSLAAQSSDSLCGSFETWDLGLRWWIDGQDARLIHPHFLDCAAPCANVANRVFWEWGRCCESDNCRPVFGGLGSDATVLWRVASTCLAEQLLARDRLCGDG